MTKNQHFIPQFYQRYWECENRGYIWEFDKRHTNGTDKGIRQQSIRTRNSEINLYEPDEANPDNAIENWYGKFETLYSTRYRKLINSRACLCRISDEEKLMICRIFANFSARNPINLYYSLKNNALASLFTLGEPNKIIDRRSIQNLIAFSEGGVGEVLGIEKELLGDFEEKLFSYKLQLLVSNEPNIIFCDSLIEQVSYPDEYFFPLCPYMVAHFSKADNIEDDKLVRKITNEEYNRFIDLYARNSFVSQIYAKERSVLDYINSKYIFGCLKFSI